VSAEGARSIGLSWELPHPPAKVWRALTEPALVAQWLLPTDLALEPGRAFRFSAEPNPWWDGIVHSEVLALEPGRRLRYAWRTAGPNGLDSVVTWTLTPSGAGTRLELLHEGFKAGQEQAFQGAGLGWRRNVAERLAAVLNAMGA
jgi:uncharacterized protein YndB with AHSA1/START domain